MGVNPRVWREQGAPELTLRIIRLGSPRQQREGLRIGTVRRPPRGIRKEELSCRNFYDVWLPNLAPSERLLKAARSASDAKEWRRFARRYRAEMRRPENSRVLDLIAALSHGADQSVGCYYADEQRCHRSILRALLAERNATLA